MRNSPNTKVSKSSRPKLRLVSRMRPSAEIAAERVRDLLLEIGNDCNYIWGWKTAAARELGLGRITTSNLIDRKVTRLGTHVIDQVVQKTGIPYNELVT